jgi:hypothetical protein
MADSFSSNVCSFFQFELRHPEPGRIRRRIYPLIEPGTRIAGKGTTAFAPHWLQNFLSLGLSALHLEHFIWDNSYFLTG